MRGLFLLPCTLMTVRRYSQYRIAEKCHYFITIHMNINDYVLLRIECLLIVNNRIDKGVYGLTVCI